MKMKITINFHPRSFPRKNWTFLIIFSTMQLILFFNFSLFMDTNNLCICLLCLISVYALYRISFYFTWISEANTKTSSVKICQLRNRRIQFLDTSLKVRNRKWETESESEKEKERKRERERYSVRKRKIERDTVWEWEREREKVRDTVWEREREREGEREREREKERKWETERERKKKTNERQFRSK